MVPVAVGLKPDTQAVNFVHPVRVQGETIGTIPEPVIAEDTREAALAALFAHIRECGWEPKIEAEGGWEPDEKSLLRDSNDVGFEYVGVGVYCPPGWARETYDVSKYADQDQWTVRPESYGEMWDEDCNCWGDLAEMELELA